MGIEYYGCEIVIGIQVRDTGDFSQGSEREGKKEESIALIDLVDVRGEDEQRLMLRCLACKTEYLLFTQADKKEKKQVWVGR